MAVVHCAEPRDGHGRSGASVLRYRRRHPSRTVARDNTLIDCSQIQAWSHLAASDAGGSDPGNRHTHNSPSFLVRHGVVRTRASCVGGDAAARGRAAHAVSTRSSLTPTARRGIDQYALLRGLGSHARRVCVLERPTPARPGETQHHRPLAGALDRSVDERRPVRMRRTATTPTSAMSTRRWTTPSRQDYRGSPEVDAGCDAVC